MILQMGQLGKICIRGYIYKNIYTPMGEVLGVFCEDLGENIPRYKCDGTAVY